ncbi:MAG: glycosyltransferase [Succinivibrio sp.]
MKKKSGLDKYDQALFFGSYTGIAQWRAVFSEFFKNTADEMIVFSDAVVPYFTKIYPDLLHKIKVIPHYVAPLTVPHITKHQGINIGVIGNISTVCKGRVILEKMCEGLATKENVNLFCFGEFNTEHDYENLKVLGPYKRDNLPSLIEQHNIDVILIPSVWPETFSYTTSEAIAMGIKVACFNYGAQAEKVKEYKNGLILNENEDNITDKLIAFVKEPFTKASNCSPISKAVEFSGK